MQHWNPNPYCISKRCIPKAKQGTKKQEDFIGKKEKKTTKLLCDTNPLVWQWILQNLPTDEYETGDKRNVKRKLEATEMQKDTENSIDGVSKQWGSLKKL